MAEQASNLGSREERVNAILAAYLDAAAAGQAPDRAELLARHPDLAAELASFFAEDAQVRRLAEPLRSVVPTDRGATQAPFNTPARPSPGVVRNFGDCEGQRYFSMKFIEGPSLFQRLASRPPESAIGREEQKEAARLLAIVGTPSTSDRTRSVRFPAAARAGSHSRHSPS